MSERDKCENKFLKQLFRKSCKNKIKNMNKFSLFSPFYMQDERYEAKNKTRPYSTKERQQLMKKSIEIINNHFYVEFESE